MTQREQSDWRRFVMEANAATTGFPSLQLRAMVHNATPGAVAFHEATDVVGLLAWLHRDALIAALEREIDAEGDDGSLSHEERQQREAEAQGDLLDIERQEAALTWQAQAEGLPVEFRSDCAPQAILGVRLVTAPRGELPASSSQHAGYDLVGKR